MASLQKIIIREGTGATPNFGDKVACKFRDLTAAGERIPIQLTDVEFSSAGHAFSVLLAVIGVQHRLSEHTMNILKPGFEFLISSLRSTKRGEWAQILNQDPERAKEANSDFFLSVELKEVVRRPEGHAPVFSDWQPRPENYAEGAAPVFLDLSPSF
ncbi:uncharacterized protein BDV17DRAFT_285918 [Aspergillus undulatus]|uniref:uncharacterized protein n=1 Tax=Aspergillus undulatus TaxID=1810928 RepID=UPI003CCDEE9D